MNNKNFQYSKIITLISIIIFCGCIVRCFCMDISTVYDLSVYGIIITSSGALCATAVVWYLKNSQAEKVAKIRADIYRIISEEKYKYNEKMFELKARYEYTEEDISDIEEDSPFEELEQEAMDSLNSSVDDAMDEATSSIEIQTVD